MTPAPSSASGQKAAVKRATPFSNYRQPVLRLKFKIQDFFVKIDHKADSLRRIRKKKLHQQRLLEYKEFLRNMHKSQVLRRQ